MNTLHSVDLSYKATHTEDMDSSTQLPQPQPLQAESQPPKRSFLSGGRFTKAELVFMICIFFFFIIGGITYGFVRSYMAEVHRKQENEARVKKFQEQTEKWKKEMEASRSSCDSCSQTAGAGCQAGDVCVVVGIIGQGFCLPPKGNGQLYSREEVNAECKTTDAVHDQRRPASNRNFSKGSTSTFTTVSFPTSQIQLSVPANWKIETNAVDNRKPEQYDAVKATDQLSPAIDFYGVPASASAVTVANSDSFMGDTYIQDFCNPQSEGWKQSKEVEGINVSVETIGKRKFIVHSSPRDPRLKYYIVGNAFDGKELQIGVYKPVGSTTSTDFNAIVSSVRKIDRFESMCDEQPVKEFSVGGLQVKVQLPYDLKFLRYQDVDKELYELSDGYRKQGLTYMIMDKAKLASSSDPEVVEEKEPLKDAQGNAYSIAGENIILTKIYRQKILSYLLVGLPIPNDPQRTLVVESGLFGIRHASPSDPVDDAKYIEQFSLLIRQTSYK